MEKSKDPTFIRLMQRNLDAFVGDNFLKREEYVTRGVIPTNNFGNYLAHDLLAEGSIERLAYDYTQSPYAAVFDAFKEQQPDEWKAARQAIGTHKQLMRQHVDQVQVGFNEALLTLTARRDAARLESERLVSNIYLQVAPQLEAAGFDPVDACL